MSPWRIMFDDGSRIVQDATSQSNSLAAVSHPMINEHQTHWHGLQFPFRCTKKSTRLQLMWLRYWTSPRLRPAVDYTDKFTL